MAVTTVQTNNKLIEFTKQINREWVRDNLFSPYMGTDITAIIRKRMELTNGGEQMNIPMVARLGATAIGSGTLAGNEESIDNYGMRVWIDWAVTPSRPTRPKSRRTPRRSSAWPARFCRTGRSRSPATRSWMRSMPSVGIGPRRPRLCRRPARQRHPVRCCATAGQRNTWVVGQRRSRAVRQAGVELFGDVCHGDRQPRHHRRQMHPRCHAVAQAHRPRRQPENPPVQGQGRPGIFRGVPRLAHVPRSQDRSGDDQQGRSRPREGRDGQEPDLPGRRSSG
jgi:hypothetical protein